MIESDEIIGKGFDSYLMKRLLTYIKPYRKFVILAIILNILVASLGPLRPYLVKIAVDDYLPASNLNGLLLIVLIISLSLIFQALIQFAMNYSMNYIGQKTLLDLRMQIFRHLERLSLKFFDKNPIGRLVTRVTNDVESLNELFSQGIVMIFSDIFIIIWIFIFMFIMSFELSIVTLSVIPVLIYITFLFRRKVRQNYRDVRKHLASLNSFMQEHITGHSVTQIFSREDKEFLKFIKINDDYKSVNIKSVLYYALFYPAVEFISSLAVALIIWYGGGKALEGTMTIGILLAFIQYTEMFFRPVRDLSEKYNILQTAMASSERIFKLLDDQSFDAQNGSKEFFKFKGSIEFKNVWFAYENENYVLRDVSFKLNPGESIAIVGATGSGKTTIINLLMKFYKINKGNIYIDGVNINDIPTEVLRKQIGLVLQDVFIFSGNFYNNINLWNDEISYEKILEASKIIGLDALISKFPDKYNQEVKERGATLSLGEKQLLSFARVLVYDPQILVLDEATASVDTDLEKLIQDAIKKLLKGRSSIVIAHRLSTIQNADKIIVLHKGRIKEIGTHSELLNLKGYYYKLYQLQYKEQEVLN